MLQPGNRVNLKLNESQLKGLGIPEEELEILLDAEFGVVVAVDTESSEKMAYVSFDIGEPFAFGFDDLIKIAWCD